MAEQTSEKPSKPLVMQGFEKSVRQARFMRAVRELADDKEVRLKCFHHLAEIAKGLPPIPPVCWTCLRKGRGLPPELEWSGDPLEFTCEIVLPLVKEWQERWQLTDGWCEGFALEVLYVWRCDPDLLKKQELPEEVYLEPKPGDFVPPPKWPARARHMTKGARDNVLKSLDDQYRKFCEREDPFFNKTYTRVPSNGWGTHYEWLALYQCAGMSARAIAERYNKPKLEALTKQRNAERDAALAGLSNEREARAVAERFDEERDAAIKLFVGRGTKYITDAITRYAAHIDLTLRVGGRGKKTTR